ncbi:predicted methyl-accepting chemotyis protein [Desulfobacula toluolica Tol2]|uniref:Predicted methyl-accepting chemotyis protein n=2 Tax=Desulfobacula toluolica TaxID=28223 RepID=K0NH82_DESTT|nr:predicted methyl-accepting chemotyis protein [Desulfobacula toluolica Tol2]
MVDKIDLTKLLPNFKSVLNGFPQSAEDLSAWFILILLGVFISFLIPSIWKSFKTFRQIKWLKNLLKEHTSETIAESRQDFIDKAQKVKHDVGHLWLEFNETLIEGDRNNKIRLYNTYDAAYFFNSATLAPGITGSRLIAAVPGFLTAIGVVGTFVGLQLGLAQLNIANDVSIEEMKAGVAGVINGAKLAFITSVWGVILSVLFNIIEKIIERATKTKITQVQNLIDKLFNRISPEEQLQRIANDGKQSRESLQGLAEKIGLKMQESLIQATEGIQSGLETSLEKIMAPAINKLVDETSDGNQKALENLLDKFMEKFGTEGGQQRQAMDDASDKMNASLASFGTSMQAFLDKMEVSQNNVAQKEEELVENISSQVNWLVENTSSQNKVLTEFIENTFGELSDKLNNRDDVAANRERIRGEEFINQTNEMKKGTSDLLERIDQGLKTQFKETRELLNQGQSLQSSITESVSANAKATKHMKETSSELNSTVSKLKTFGGYIHQTGMKLSETITAAVASTETLAKENQASTSEIKKIFERILVSSNEFNTLIQKMKNLVDTADTMFEKMDDQQHSYLAQLKQNVEELAVKMSNLLKDYASQANGQTAQHLRVWAEGTTQYTTSMNNAAQALASVVDDIEVKLGR